MANRQSVARKIAAAMVDTLNESEPFRGVIQASQVANPKRAVEQLPEGTSIVDVIAQGASYEPRNRRTGTRTYQIYLAVHTRLLDGEVTNEALDEASWWAEQAQELFHTAGVRGIDVEGESAVCIGSEPFPVSRDALFGHGLHMATMRFDWQFLR
jgi:2-keto-4-pentenoate hydratase/2-oxohepta-3-ene-1,7-dioic acid hydratase in catechol pathway